MEMIWTTIERIKSFFGRTVIKKTGTAIFTGEERDGGYYYLKSADLPGFTFLMTPDEANDANKLTEALGPSLNAYLRAHHDYERRKITQNVHPRISFGPKSGKTMNLIAELCN